MENLDTHFWTLIVIIIIIGSFGGYLNYLHNFDTTTEESKNRVEKFKYIFLGIGASILVPAFLKMIASDLIKETKPFDNINYLIFGGFCLVASIFSRRFITTIGERILEAAKNAEASSKEAKKEIESTKIELSSTQERIEDVKLAVNLKENRSQNIEGEKTKAIISVPNILIDLASSYVEKTTIPDYAERLKMKAELGRNMGQIIVRNNLSKEQLLKDYPSEGMYLAVAYSVELKPDKEGLKILNELSSLVLQLYTKYVILIAYRTLASSGYISEIEASSVKNVAESFKRNADKPLLRNIDDTITVLKFINPNI